MWALLKLETDVDFPARMLDLICESELLVAASSMFADRQKTLWHDHTLSHAKQLASIVSHDDG